MDVYIVILFVVLYLKYGNFGSLYKIFERVVEKDVVLWILMIFVFVQNDDVYKVLMVFCQMLGFGVMFSSAIIVIVFVACVKINLFFLGILVYGFLLRRRILLDIFV